MDIMELRGLRGLLWYMVMDHGVNRDIAIYGYGLGG